MLSDTEAGAPIKLRCMICRNEFRKEDLIEEIGPRVVHSLGEIVRTFHDPTFKTDVLRGYKCKACLSRSL